MKHTQAAPAVLLACAAHTALFPAPAPAQSLFQRPASEPARPASPPGAPASPTTPPASQSKDATAAPPRPPAAAAPLAGFSLYVVTPPPPRTFQKHDTVQILINESSVQKFESSLDTEKQVDSQLTLGPLPSLRHLLEAQIRQGDSDPLIDTSTSGNNAFEGDGTFERKDRFTTRIAATIIEVKPNGLLVLEARKITQSDDETVTLVLSGVARPDDITTANTVQSSQLTNLTIRSHSDGELRKAAKKGLIPRALDLIFNL